MHGIQPACTRILFKNQVHVHIETLVNDSAYQMKRSMILVNKSNSDWSSVIQSTEMLTDRSENVTKDRNMPFCRILAKRKGQPYPVTLIHACLHHLTPIKKNAPVLNPFM